MCVCVYVCVCVCFAFYKNMLYLKRVTVNVLESAFCVALGNNTLNKTFCTVRKEGNVLFNDALNTFYLRLYGVRHMVKDHSEREKCFI